MRSFSRFSQVDIKLFLTVFVSIGVVGSALAQSHYSFHSFDAPFGSNSEAWGINEDGLLAGQYTDSDGNTQVFTDLFGHFKSHRLPGSVAMYTGAPNNLGQIPVSYDLPNGTSHSAVLRDGTFKLFEDIPGFSTTLLSAITDNGLLGGTAANATFSSGVSFIARQHLGGRAITFIEYPGAQFTYLTGLNRYGVAVGSYSLGNNTPPFHSYVYDRGTYKTIVFPGSASDRPFSINDRGEISGFYRLISLGPRHGFIFTKGKWKTLDYPGATDTIITFVNAENGNVTGIYSSDGFFSEHAFVAIPNEG